MDKGNPSISSLMLTSTQPSIDNTLKSQWILASTRSVRLWVVK